MSERDDMLEVSRSFGTKRACDKTYGEWKRLGGRGFVIDGKRGGPWQVRCYRMPIVNFARWCAKEARDVCTSSGDKLDQ